MKDYLDRMKLLLSGRSIAQTMAVIAKARLFDASWYASQAPEAARSGMDLLRHYVVFGAAQGLNPHPLFDGRWYLSQCPCDARARANPIRWYLKGNPDVAAAKLNPLVHYVTCGAAEGRNPHPLFDTEWYLHHNPEVAAAGLNPLTHYLTHGVPVRGGPNPLFDTAWYIARNPDVAWEHQNPLVHYITTGASEGRDPNPLFDTDWYLEQNPDVALAGTNPLAHYMDAGVSEGRDPNPLFDTDWYLERNPEVAGARINPLAHYLAGAYGWCEPNWWFDTHSYVAMNPDAGAAGVNPLAHYLATNLRAQRRRDAAFAAARRALPGLATAEPRLASIAGQLSNLRYITGHARGLGFARWRDLLSSFAQVYDRMIFMPRIDGGAASLAGLGALRAAQQRFGSASILLILTDGSDSSSRNLRVPEGTHMRVLSQLDARLTEEDRTQITLALIYHLQPKAVLNADSAILSRVLEGRAPALARVSRLYGYFGQLRSQEAGSQHEHDWLSHLSRIYFDDPAVMNLFVRDYGALRDRFVLLPEPPSLRHDAMVDAFAGTAPDTAQTPSETAHKFLHVGFDPAEGTSWRHYFELFAESPSFLD